MRKRRGAMFRSLKLGFQPLNLHCCVDDVGLRSAKLWTTTTTTTAKAGMTQMLWSYNALHHTHCCHWFPLIPSPPSCSPSNASFPSFLPVIHQDHTPRQHPGPVHLLHNIMLRCFIVRPSFLLANHLRLTWCLPVFHTRTHSISFSRHPSPEMCDVPLRDRCHHSSVITNRMENARVHALHIAVRMESIASLTETKWERQSLWVSAFLDQPANFKLRVRV